MIAAALAAAAVAFAPGTDESFEAFSSLPPEWKLVEYVPGAGAATIETGDAAKGERFLRIASSEVNHVRVQLPVPVERQATYRLSVRVRSTASQPVPAVLNVEGTDPVTQPVPGDGQWHSRRLYLRTGDADTATVLLSLGWYHQTVAGSADFDLVKLKKIDAAPADAPVAELASAATTAPVAADLGPRKAMLPLTGVMLLLIAGCGAALLRGGRVA